MRIRLSWFVVAFVVMLLMPAAARADGHRAGLFGGFSVAEGSVLNGANLTFDYAGKDAAKKYFAVMADYSVHDGDGFKRQIFTGGVSASRRFNRVVVAAHGLLGGVWGDGSSDVAGTFGADFEVIAVPKVLTPSAVQIAPLVRADYIVRGGPAPSFWRVSTGLVVRWPK